MGTAFARLMLVSCACVLLTVTPLPADPVPVLFAEGVTHGFLVLHDADGKLLAHGDLLQTWRNGEVDKQMVFHFKDGSLFDEKVTFTQKGVFVLKKYTLTTKGPAFKDDKETVLNAETGAYRVETKDRKSGKTDVDDGTLKLPPDVYNGLVQTIGKNFKKGAGATVHMAIFSPVIKVIELEMVPAGEHKIKLGDLTRSSEHYLLKFKLGKLMGLLAKLTGRSPDDSNLWVALDRVPSFIAYRGALSEPDQNWQIEMVSPRLK